jgi:hypothetical protein
MSTLSCGGTPIARWVVNAATTAVIRAGDALIVTVVGCGDGGGGGGGGDGDGDRGDGGAGGGGGERVHRQRAFVLSFLDACDIEAAHAALQRAIAPSTAAAAAAAAANDGGTGNQKNQKKPAATAAADDDNDSPTNVFDAKIEKSSAADYFRYYAMIPQQQNMLQDRVRTGTYFTAIMENAADFRGKVVLDVGRDLRLTSTTLVTHLTFYEPQLSARVFLSRRSTTEAVTMCEYLQ